jgi:hypothetical protein
VNLQTPKDTSAQKSRNLRQAQKASFAGVLRERCRMRKLGSQGLTGGVDSFRKKSSTSFDDFSSLDNAASKSTAA